MKIREEKGRNKKNKWERVRKRPRNRFPVGLKHNVTNEFVSA